MERSEIRDIPLQHRDMEFVLGSSKRSIIARARFPDCASLDPGYACPVIASVAKQPKLETKQARIASLLRFIPIARAKIV